MVNLNHYSEFENDVVNEMLCPTLVWSFFSRWSLLFFAFILNDNFQPTGHLAIYISNDWIMHRMEKNETKTPQKKNALLTGYSKEQYSKTKSKQRKRTKINYFRFFFPHSCSRELWESLIHFCTVAALKMVSINFCTRNLAQQTRSHFNASKRKIIHYVFINWQSFICFT